MFESALNSLSSVALIPGVGFSELIVILVIIVVLFGASRLPQLGRGLGEGIRNFKSGLKSDGELPESTSKESAAKET